MFNALLGSRTRKMLVAGSVVGFLSLTSARAQVDLINDPIPADDNVDIEDAHGTLHDTMIIFQQVVKGTANGTAVPSYGFGILNGAAVLGHVFPTTLSSTDIGFSETEGTVALAITAHPDFDDTPLEDEDGDGDTGNDGGLIHSHWVVLVGDSNVAGGFSVKELDLDDPNIIVPATHPGLPLYIDSPNFFVDAEDDTISVHVPIEAVNNRSDFQFGAVTSFLEVHGDAEPLLGVYVIYDVLGGSLTPFDIVPEPSSVALLTLGLAGIIRRGRRG